MVDGQNMLSAPLEGQKWILKACDGSVSIAAVTRDFILWHRRLGHPNNISHFEYVFASSCHSLHGQTHTVTIPLSP